MNIELLNEVVRKFHLGEFHSEDTKLENKTILDGETLKYAPYLCFCDVQNNEVTVLYDEEIGDENIIVINSKIRELESQGKIFEAFVQLAYFFQIRVKQATNYRVTRNLEVFPTDYENFVAYTQFKISFREELKRSKESWDRFVVSFANSINRAREKEKLTHEKSIGNENDVSQSETIK